MLGDAMDFNTHNQLLVLYEATEPGVLSRSSASASLSKGALCRARGTRRSL